MADLSPLRGGSIDDRIGSFELIKGTKLCLVILLYDKLEYGSYFEVAG